MGSREVVKNVTKVFVRSFAIGKTPNRSQNHSLVAEVDSFECRLLAQGTTSFSFWKCVIFASYFLYKFSDFFNEYLPGHRYRRPAWNCSSHVRWALYRVIFKPQTTLYIGNIYENFIYIVEIYMKISYILELFGFAEKPAAKNIYKTFHIYFEFSSFFYKYCPKFSGRLRRPKYIWKNHIFGTKYIWKNHIYWAFSASPRNFLI